MSAIPAALWGRFLCRIGLHQIVYEWKTKRPYCERSKPCTATDSVMRRLTKWAEG